MDLVAGCFNAKSHTYEGHATGACLYILYNKEAVRQEKRIPDPAISSGREKTPREF